MQGNVFDFSKVVVHGYNLVIRLMTKDMYITRFSLGGDDIDRVAKAKVREIELSNGQGGIAMDNNPYLAFGEVIKCGTSVKGIEVGDYVYITYSVMNPENMFFLQPLDMVESGMTDYLIIPEHSIRVSISGGISNLV